MAFVLIWRWIVAILTTFRFCIFVQVKFLLYPISVIKQRDVFMFSIVSAGMHLCGVCLCVWMGKHLLQSFCLFSMTYFESIIYPAHYSTVSHPIVLWDLWYCKRMHWIDFLVSGLCMSPMAHMMMIFFTSYPRITGKEVSIMACSPWMLYFLSSSFQLSPSAWILILLTFKTVLVHV